MKYFHKTIKLDTIEIVCLSDWHAGSSAFDIKLAKKYIKYICEHDNVYVIGMGDLTNNALKNSKSDVYTSMSPSDEIELVCNNELLGAIPKERWLLFTSGNHGARTSREVGIDLDELIARRLGIESVYSPYLSVINVSLNCNSYYITTHHSTGGGGTLGGKVNVLSKLSKLVVGADIVIGAHTHTPVACPIIQYIIDKKHNRIQELVTYMINAGSLHGFDNSYAEEKMLPPSLLGQAIITIESSGNNTPKRIFTRWII